MPEREDVEQHLHPIRLSDEFVEGLAHIWSPRVLDHIKGLLKLLQTNPELGSARIRPSLARRYGDSLRKLSVSNYLIIYRFDGDVVDVLAIVYGPSVA